MLLPPRFDEQLTARMVVMKKVASYEGFDIYFEAGKECVPMRKHFVEECGWSKEEYASLIASKPKWFSAHVFAMKCGIELGADSLGCCCYNSYEDFYTTYFGCYFKDMMKRAVDEAKNRLPAVLRDLKSQSSKLTSTIEALEASTLTVE